MKIVTWNYQGLGNHPTVRGLLDLHKTKSVDILFLRMVRFKWMLGLGNMVVRSCVRKGGKLLCCGGDGSMWL
jgi:hypothetical protein